MTLRKIRIKQKEEDEKKRLNFMNKKKMTEKEQDPNVAKKKFVIAAAEMEKLNELKRQLIQQNNYL